MATQDNANQDRIDKEKKLFRLMGMMDEIALQIFIAEVIEVLTNGVPENPAQRQQMIKDKIIQFPTKPDGLL